ncbi:hypothetical protein BFP70_19455 [Thioclava sp. SK-1]|nr:hypothetical protein BFP70_19455 [Thioclava sp. SK-1]
MRKYGIIIIHFQALIYVTSTASPALRYSEVFGPSWLRASFRPARIWQGRNDAQPPLGGFWQEVQEGAAPLAQWQLAERLAENCLVGCHLK